MAAPSPAQVEVTLASLKLDRVIELKGHTYHVQGVVVDGDWLWVTSVERENRKGRLHRFARESGELHETVEIQSESRYHPGGFDHDATSLWIPIAEYRRDSSAAIERRSKHTLQVISSHAVSDHLGCVAKLSTSLIAGNWDSRVLHRISLSHDPHISFSSGMEGNPSSVRYQEIKYRDGWLIASGVINSEQGAIEWLEPHRLRVAARILCGLTSRSVLYTNEGMDVADGRLYLLPEDSPSRVFVFVLPRTWPPK